MLRVASAVLSEQRFKCRVRVLFCMALKVMVPAAIFPETVLIETIKSTWVSKGVLQLRQRSLLSGCRVPIATGRGFPRRGITHWPEGTIWVNPRRSGLYGGGVTIFKLEGERAWEADIEFDAVNLDYCLYCVQLHKLSNRGYLKE